MELLELTAEERELVNKHLTFYKALASGRLEPTTQEQEHFVRVCVGSAEPESAEEVAYMKYRTRQMQLFGIGADGESTERRAAPSLIHALVDTPISLYPEEGYSHRPYRTPATNMAAILGVSVESERAGSWSG